MANEVNYSEKYDVFLSYRRDGGETMAILLRDRLVAKGYNVFLDIESLNSGSFNKKLLSIIENCTDVVVVCSKNSLDRCKNEGDWVRTEIAHALKSGKNVVPVMLRGFEWPDVLPEEMEELRLQNGVNANSSEFFDAAIDRLASKFLQSMPHGFTTKKPKTLKLPKTKQSIAPKNKGILIAALSLLLLLGLVFVGITFRGKKGGTDITGMQKIDVSNQSYTLVANVSVGDVITLNDSYKRCKEWRVLSVENGLVLIILDCYPPSTMQFDFYTIRQYLNNEFLPRFDNDAKIRVVETTYQLGLKSYTDKVFLLSKQQVEQYMQGELNPFRMMKTDFGEEVINWWLYDIASSPDRAPVVSLKSSSTKQYGISEGFVSDSYAIRPAMWIKLVGANPVPNSN